MTIKRPTMKQPIVDDPNLNLRNGASDGAGNPDGVDIDGAFNQFTGKEPPDGIDVMANKGGETDAFSTEIASYNEAVMLGEDGTTVSGGVNRPDIAAGAQDILQKDGSLSREDANILAALNATGDTDISSLDITVRAKMTGPNGESAAKMKADGFNKVTYNAQTGKYDWSKVDYNISNNGEEGSKTASGTQGGGYTLPSTSGKTTSYSPNGTFTYAGVEVFNYKTASELLKGVAGGSPIESVLSNYDETLSKGEPEIESMVIDDIDPNSPTFGDPIKVDIVLGTDSYSQTQGWGYYTTEEVQTENQK
jgi:hypothetical protein